VAYVVDPCNQWWLLNDLPRAPKEPTFDPEQVEASVIQPKADRLRFVLS